MGHNSGWRSASGERWLSMLIETMEEISARNACRALRASCSPCARSLPGRHRFACLMPRATACETEYSGFRPPIRPRSAAAAACPFDAAQPGLLPRDVVARHGTTPWRLVSWIWKFIRFCFRNDISEPPVKFPHPGKALVVEPHGFFASRHEAFAPCLQRLRIMQPQDLDVADQKSGPLDRRQDLRKRGDVAAREDVFCDPGIGDVGPGRSGRSKCSTITPSSLSSSAQRLKKVS